MTVDPMFIANADLPDVDNANLTFIERVLCGGDRLFQVTLDGDQTPVCVPEGQSYPAWEDMPLALRIEKVPSMGPPQVITDNREAILAAYQSQQAGVECLASDGDELGDTGDAPSEGDSSDESTSGPTYDLPYDVTCGCSTERGEMPIGVALGLGLLALLGPWRRRHRGVHHRSRRSDRDLEAATSQR
jgi:MYXO-CTERM domain-containing protein